jgi:hypothetical protein
MRSAWPQSGGADMTLPPFPAHLAKPMKIAALDSMNRLDGAAKSMHVAYYTDGSTAEYHFKDAMRQFGLAAAALGYTLTPIPAPVQAPATAEALFDGVPV